jgi:hypothetical protein
VSDIFREVDEEVRREQLKKLWERYGSLAVAAAVVVVLAVAGWRGYGWWQAKVAAESGTAFEAATALSEAGKHAEAGAAFAKIAAEGASGYRVLARVREATELAHDDRKAAVAAYDKVAADAGAGPVLQDLAALRAAILLVDTASYDELRQRLEPLTAAERTFRHTAREMLALSAWRAGDAAAAKRWFDMIIADEQTPTANRARVETLMALLAAEGKV